MSDRPSVTLTAAQATLLRALAEGPLDDAARVVHARSAATMGRLIALGLARHYPSGKPPNWRITQVGRDRLANLDKPDE